MIETSHPEASAEGFTQASESAPPSKLAGERNTMPVYELGFHVVPTVGDDGVAAVVEKIRTALGKSEIISEQFPTRMTLAYTVERSVQGKREKYTESYFGFIKFAMERSEVKAFENALHAMPQVLRSLIIETVREDAPAPRRAVFTSRQLEGETIKKPEVEAEKKSEVSEEELNKSIDALVAAE